MSTHLREQWRRTAGRSGDRHVMCADGEVRWGAYGAAGLLAMHDGKYFLQHRSAGVDEGNTWAIPGGALEEGEDPTQGALREFAEEVGVKPSGTILREYRDQVAEDWCYTTVIMEVDDKFEHEASTWEAKHGKWVTADEMKSMNLHPGFKSALPHLKLGKLQAYFHGTAHPLPLGTIIEPQGLGRRSPVWDYSTLWVEGEPDSEWRGDVVWMSMDPKDALEWASFDMYGSGEYHVYIVEPLGAVKRDPTGFGKAVYTTRARIVGEWDENTAMEPGYSMNEWTKAASVGMHSQESYNDFERQYGIAPEEIDALYRGLPVPLDEVRTEW